MNGQILAATVLADSDSGRASPVGLFVILLLCIAVYFLWRSLNRHLKRVPPSFDPPPARTAPTEAERRAREAQQPDKDRPEDRPGPDGTTGAPGGTGNPRAMR